MQWLEHFSITPAEEAKEVFAQLILEGKTRLHLHLGIEISS